MAIIRSDRNKVRTDRIITRWLKRHLQRLGAEVHLDRLNSLVEIAVATGLDFPLDHIRARVVIAE